MRYKHPEYTDKFEQKKAEVMKIRAEKRSGTLDTLDIGEANPESNLNDSVLFSHNYYRREKTTSKVAECLMCDLAQIKTFIRTSSTKGLIGHLRRKHFEYFAQFEMNRAEVLKRRTEKKNPKMDEI